MNKNKLFIVPHLGLGDYLLCNGLIRKLCKKYESCSIPVRHQDRESMERMFYDVTNVFLIFVSGDDEVQFYCNIYEKNNYEILKLGFFGKGFMSETQFFDKSFYDQAQIEYESRWADFYCPRFENEEKMVYNKIVGDKKDYIFVHEDDSRGLIIKRSLIKSDFPIVKPVCPFSDSTINFFDYGKVLENASEIHCMDSSFACLIDHIQQLNNKPKYIHRYLRDQNMNPYYKNNWEIV